MEFIYDATASIMQFIQANQNWAIPIMFLLAFGESLALVSLIIPATAILLGAGALIGADLLPFFPIWLAATVGAILGDWISYWLGKHYHDKIIKLWPLSKNQRLIVKGEQFFYRWGFSGVFVGRFFGPLRAIVPLIAGTMRMSSFKFSIANVTSAPLWAFVLLAPGAFGISWLETLFG
ncbi:DedA family protein [Zophobihabitans entericus]|uniref:DedA family protein n=1 Tax=Zophobihabitans entericus TaxID=1635327 RepID=A0A6G9IBF3_9GAMM|nr:DedA family protein [Zophobihabitans entericus]QIQ21553.1 DedA family protein [Zophobihabitans entericus]